MFQFRRFPSYGYLFKTLHRMMTVRYHCRIAPFGYPRIIMPICGSPWLIAAYRVLRRLPVPRHPPCALLRLTKLCSNLSFSRLVVILPTYPTTSDGVNNKTLLYLFAFPLFNFQGASGQLTYYKLHITLPTVDKCVLLSSVICELQFVTCHGGLKWTRTTDLTLIRRAL